jgi:catechol 2,3-dioxygenase
MAPSVSQGLEPARDDGGGRRGGVVIETEGLTHLHLFVADLDRSLRFSREVFGFEEAFRDGPTMVFLHPPGSTHTITLSEVPARAGAAGGVDHFGFRLRDKGQLDRAIAEVERAGGRLVERGERVPGRPYAYVLDPDGYTIEL